MTVTGGALGELTVHTKYAFAYAFAPDDPRTITGPMDLVTVLRVDADCVVRDAAHFSTDFTGLWAQGWNRYAYSINCSAFDRGVLAPTFSERSTATGTPDDVEAASFDPALPMPTASNCPAP
ncbi:hypothetical protein L6E12_07670 [Actinokineospora sp. PR83]|uniref:hypothetical protein n=1 Tax=Actinokineospora sp. PR83 TaxID=2884908 RepID=UPI001F44BB57|nr:hypothetical protein [Actinokineospora sp. PR83]MCG8915662.1 hypothetical protein [Actinokineospora sp. PR83]